MGIERDNDLQGIKPKVPSEYVREMNEKLEKINQERASWNALKDPDRKSTEEEYKKKILELSSSLYATNDEFKVATQGQSFAQELKDTLKKIRAEVKAILMSVFNPLGNFKSCEITAKGILCSLLKGNESQKTYVDEYKEKLGFKVRSLETNKCAEEKKMEELKREKLRIEVLEEFNKRYLSNNETNTDYKSWEKVIIRQYDEDKKDDYIIQIKTSGEGVKPITFVADFDMDKDKGKVIRIIRDDKNEYNDYTSSVSSKTVDIDKLEDEKQSIDKQYKENEDKLKQIQCKRIKYTNGMELLA